MQNLGCEFRTQRQRAILKTVCDSCRRMEDCVWFLQTDWRLCVIPADGLKTVCDSRRRVENCVWFLQTDWRLCVIPADRLKLKFLKWKRRNGGQFFAPKSHSFNSRHQQLFYHWYDGAEIFPKSMFLGAILGDIPTQSTKTLCRKGLPLGLAL